MKVIDLEIGNHYQLGVIWIEFSALAFFKKYIIKYTCYTNPNIKKKFFFGQ